MNLFFIILTTLKLSHCSDIFKIYNTLPYCSYPYAHVNYASLQGYGATKRLPAYQGCNVNSMPSLTYKSDYDETYVLVPSTKKDATPAGSITKVKVSCSVSSCATNQYKLNNKCVQCPIDMPRSNAGSSSINNCFSCPGGTSLPHPLATVCTLSDDFLPISRSKGWRVWVPEYQTVSKIRWGVKLLEFYATSDCSGSAYIPNGIAINSRNFGTAPDLAFSDSAGAWSGKADNDGAIWVGMTFSAVKSVQCVKLVCTSNSVTEVRVQALVGNSEDSWANVWVQKDLDTAKNVEQILSFEHPPTVPPTEPPTKYPTESPTKEPTSEPTKHPTATPSTSSSPTSLPTEAPTKRPTEQLTNFSTNYPTRVPTKEPTRQLTQRPTETPTSEPTISPTQKPTKVSTSVSTSEPTISPTQDPTKTPTDFPTTKMPTASPTKSVVPSFAPTERECKENKDDKFLKKVRQQKNKVVLKTCSWLGEQEESIRQNLCSKSREFQDFKPAWKVCPITCQFCIQCVDNDDQKFLSRMKSNGKPEKKDCAWLRSKSSYKKSIVCNRNESFRRFQPARNTCYATCNSCPGWIVDAPNS
mmetsp:Transcript_28820/g.33484  ORF Transcript_28820/g.33484 Transcript_28820/m.33484 type:complete len:583 (-) Transcript_28820:111-1859(-)